MPDAWETFPRHVYQGATLPYTDNLINLLIVDSVAAQLDRGLTLAEMLRVVTPLGELWCGSSRDTAIDGEDWKTLANRARTWGCTVEQTEGVSGRWFRIIKPFSPETDQWTHFLHGADGNPVADDQVVGPPRHYQWTGDPIWLRSHETDSSVSTMVTAQGRLFSIVDEAPIGVAGDHDLPDKWFLRAHDAFNGVPLWKVPIRRWGWREWKYSWFATRPGDYPFDIRKRLVAVGDRVYVTLGYRAPVSELDARTGEILRTFSGTESTSELMVADGQLLLSVHEEDSLRIMAIDLASGTVAWRSSKTYAGTTTDYLKWTAMRGSVRAPQVKSSGEPGDSWWSRRLNRW